MDGWTFNPYYCKKNNYIENNMYGFSNEKFIDSNIYTNGINIVVDMKKYFA